MPGEQQLPPGPRRDLAVALHDLYELAGKPAARAISSWIRDREDLPGTLSHEGVSAVLRGVGMPRWANLESLVRVLVEEQRVGTSDVDTVVMRMHTLWRMADGGRVLHDASSAMPPASHETDSHEALARNDEPTRLGPGDLIDETGPLPSGPKPPLIRWNHPRLGTVDFRDRQTAVEIFKEVGGFDD